MAEAVALAGTLETGSSSKNTLEHSRIHDTGNYQPGYGEGAYVGSDASSANDNTLIRYNEGYRNGNASVVDAFQVRTHGSGDDAPGYVVYATSATTGTTASGDVRIGGGNLYNGNVNR